MSLPAPFLEQWVLPFYARIGDCDDAWIQTLCAVRQDITDEVIRLNLNDFNWRTRQTGAFFAAITGRTAFIDLIGAHLLASEVVYAGGVYCVVLASFNTPACVEYLNRYLTRYLAQPDAWFDQRDAMEALLYLDQQNNTRHVETHWPNWVAFLKNKPHWKEALNTDFIAAQVAVFRIVNDVSG